MKRRRKKHRPLKGFTLYLDHNVDYDDVADALRRAGIRFQRHRDHFSGSAPDTDLLKKVGKRRWILITHDKKQRTRLIEKQLILQYRVRQFVFTSSRIGDVGAVLVKASKTMRNICRRNPGPFVYSITEAGNVNPLSLS